MNKLLKQPLFMIGAAILSVVILVAFLGSIIRPDASIDASQQNRTLAKLPPLTNVQFLKVRKNQIISRQPLRKRVLLGGQKSFYQLIPFERYNLAGQFIELTYNEDLVRVHAADVIYPIGDDELRDLKLNTDNKVEFRDLEGNQVSKPITELLAAVKEDAIITKTFVLGTDTLGRDVLSRLMAGSAVSLLIGFLSVIFSLLIGLVVGVISGYFGGTIDLVLSWVINLFGSIPAILFAIVIAYSLGGGTSAVIIGVSLVLWVEMAQIIRQTVLSVSKKEYIKASRLLGLSHWQILRRHIIPNILSPVFVLVASTFADAIILESGLSFLGIGIMPPQPSWGGMIRETYGFIISEGSAYLALVPSIVLVVVVAAFVFVSNGLKQAMHYSIGRAGVNRV